MNKIKLTTNPKFYIRKDFLLKLIPRKRWKNF